MGHEWKREGSELRELIKRTTRRLAHVRVLRDEAFSCAVLAVPDLSAVEAGHGDRLPDCPLAA